MSFALPARQVTFGRAAPQQAQQQQAQQQQQQGQAQFQQYQAPQAANATAGGSGLALPGPAPSNNYYKPQHYPAPTREVVPQPAAAAPSPVPATPIPLTLEQQHITAVEGIVPTLQNIVATVNLDCRLDLKTIALHARNAEYNPKVCSLLFSAV